MKCHFIGKKKFELHSPCLLLVYQHFISTSTSNHPSNRVLLKELSHCWGFKTQHSPEESVSEQLCRSAGRTNLPFMKSPKEREWWSSQAWWRTNLFHKWHEIWMLPSQRWNPSSQEEFSVPLGQAGYITSSMSSWDTMRVQKAFYPDISTALTGSFDPVIRFVWSHVAIILLSKPLHV